MVMIQGIMCRGFKQVEYIGRHVLSLIAKKTKMRKKGMALAWVRRLLHMPATIKSVYFENVQGANHRLRLEGSTPCKNLRRESKIGGER